MSEGAKKESVLKVLKSGDYLDGPDDPDFNDYGFVAPETEDLYRNYMENANAAIQLSNTNQKTSKSKRQRKSTKKASDEKRKVQKVAETKLKKMKRSLAVSKIFKAPKPSSQLLTAQEKLEQDLAKREYDRKLLENTRSMVYKKPDVDGQSIDEITGNLYKFSPTSADDSCKPNSTINFLNKSPTICKNDGVVATPSFLKAAAARRATEPDGSISKFALQLKMECQQRVDSESEDYDSDLEDFIDDSGCQPTVSPDACEMIDYDEHNYSDHDVMDDGCKESSYAQVQHEEQMSKRLGWEEDQEDMRLEAKENKIKMEEYERTLLENTRSMVYKKPVEDGQSIDEITGNLYKFSPTSADDSYKPNTAINFLNKSPTICKNDGVVATPSFLKAAAARRATEPDGSISKFALQLKMECQQRVDSESEDYDSDLEDFIDDSGCQPTVSPDACEMIDYDEHNYTDHDVMDDGCKESSYAQVQHEEQMSKRLGWEED